LAIEVKLVYGFYQPYNTGTHKVFPFQTWGEFGDNTPCGNFDKIGIVFDKLGTGLCAIEHLVPSPCFSNVVGGQHVFAPEKGYLLGSGRQGAHEWVLA
jgi:hypothetical protein